MSELLARPYWYLRHGETDWNAKSLSQGSTDIPLNETGLAQAAEAGRILAECFVKGQRPFDRIISSPLSRALVTAERVRDAIRDSGGPVLPLSLEEDLREVSFGVREGKPIGDWYGPWINENFVPEGAESFIDLRDRAVRGVNRALQAGEGAPLIVAHGALFRALRSAMGLEVDVRLPNATPLFVTPGGAGWQIAVQAGKKADA